jgi:hypothetical protein
MSEKTEFKELSKNRTYLLKTGEVEITAMKLEGYKAIQLEGTISPVSIGAGGSKEEGDDWLLIVKDKNDIVMPYEVWAKQMAQEITRISGSNVSTVSVVSSIPSYNTKIVNSVDELAQAYAEGWTEPYQFQSGRWILKKSKQLRTYFYLSLNPIMMKIFLEKKRYLIPRVLMSGDVSTRVRVRIQATHHILHTHFQTSHLIFHRKLSF